MQVLRAIRREEVAQKGICKIIAIKMGNILSTDVNQTWLKHKSYLRSELARTLSSIESTNNKNQNNSPQTYGRWVHLGRNITYECLLNQSVSVLYIKF